MKRALGVSVYPDHSDINQDKAYLKSQRMWVYSNFYEYVRSDRWQRSGSEKFKELISYAKNLGFETILDVVPSIFDELEISYDDLTFQRIRS